MSPRRNEIETPQGNVCIQACNTEYANIGIRPSGWITTHYYRYDLPDLVIDGWKESYGTQRVVFAPWDLQPREHNVIVQANKDNILALIDFLNKP